MAEKVTTPATTSDTKLVGWYTRDPTSHYSVDTKLLPYLSKPADLTSVNFDLSAVHGDCRPVNKDVEGSSLEEICRWIAENKKDENRALSNYKLEPTAWSSVDVVCTRSALKNLLLLKFGKKKIFIQACRVGGVIFLSAKDGKNKDEKKYKDSKDGDKKKEEKHKDSKENKKEKDGKDMKKEGDKEGVKEKNKDKKKEKCKDERTLDAKLKHYLISDTKGGASSPGTANKCNSLAFVFLTELPPAGGDTAAIKVLHSGSMDAVSGEVEGLGDDSSVFIKTASGEPDEKVLMSWWAQCVISRSRDVIVGVREKDGHVRRLREMSLQQIEAKIKERRTDWSGEQSVHRAKAVLDEVKRSMTLDNEAKSFSYKLDTSHAQGFVLKTEASPAAKDSLLPAWYLTGAELK